MVTLTKDMLMDNVIGEFTWMYNHIYFVETKLGNFLYSSPDYEGDNTLTQYHGSYRQYTNEHGLYGRAKGSGFLQIRLPEDFVLVLTPEPEEEPAPRRNRRAPLVVLRKDQHYQFDWPDGQAATYKVISLKDRRYTIEWPNGRLLNIVHGCDIHKHSKPMETKIPIE